MKPFGPGSSLVLFTFILTLAGCSVEAVSTPVLRFTAIPDKDSTELTAKFRPVAGYLSERLGVEVEYVPVSDYDGSVEAFVNGDVHLAWFGGLTGVQARARVEGAQAIAQGTTDPKFKSYFIAHESTDLEKSDEFPRGIEGMLFTFGNVRSTSGRLMPEYYIREHTGKSPEEFFGRPNDYSGAHDKTATLVAAGTYQVGALNYQTYDDLVAEGRIDPNVCRVIWVTPEYPDYNWTAHPDLIGTFGPDFIGRLQRALLDMKDPELLKAVARKDGLVKASNADFQPIHDLATDLGFLK